MIIATTKEIQNKRLDICLSCEHLFKKTRTCKKCGCFMMIKTWVANADCPINKWNTINNTSESVVEEPVVIEE